jgi:hypothetical protein
LLFAPCTALGVQTVNVFAAHAAYILAHWIMPISA